MRSQLCWTQSRSSWFKTKERKLIFFFWEARHLTIFQSTQRVLKSISAKRSSCFPASLKHGMLSAMYTGKREILLELANALKEVLSKIHSIQMRFAISLWSYANSTTLMQRWRRQISSNRSLLQTKLFFRTYLMQSHGTSSETHISRTSSLMTRSLRIW